MPSRVAFDKTCARLKAGDELTLEMIGNVFGQPFWVLIVMCFLESQDAARAIQGAIRRLGTKEEPDVVTAAEIRESKMSAEVTGGVLE
jgi:hypothetical protein